ncbi:MAG: hypothetical protein ABI995_02795, partial [Acidobacteriota bacterium]
PLPGVSAARALTRVRGVSIAELSARDRDGNMPALEDFGRQLKGDIYDISEALTALHFSHLHTIRFAPA